MPELAVGVEELHLRVHDVGRLDRLAGLEGLVDGLAGLQVLDADAVEGLALAGLDEFVVNDHTGIVIDDDAETGTEFVGAVICHGCRSCRSGCPLSARRYDTGFAMPFQSIFRTSPSPGALET